MAAQESFSALLNDHVAPELRRLGWQGSGQRWLRPDRAYWVLLGWQRSGGSGTTSMISFTGNLKVIAKDGWDAEDVPRGRRPQRPSATTEWGVGWERRLRGLLPGTHGDRWWSVRPGDDVAVIAADVLGALTAWGIPALDRELAAAAARPQVCWHNSGGHNWFRPCGRPGVARTVSRTRIVHRCEEHAATSPD